MFRSAKRLVGKASKLLKIGQTEALTASDVEVAREYIEKYWSKLTCYHPKDDKTLVGLPYPYLVPSIEGSDNFSFNEMYYWDSYFMVQGMLDEEHADFVKGVLEDLLTLMQRFHIIPNASRTYFTGRSQPPFLTSFILDVYKLRPDKVWLEKAMAIAKEEYDQVWTGEQQPNWRQVYLGLSRYYDVNALHDLAEAESGWDMTTRFGRKALNYVPVDLNALLYKYETDFAVAADILGNHSSSKEWKHKAEKRKATMNRVMWSKAFGVYFDYNYAKKRRGIVVSLATYYPMWTGMVTKKQARQLVKSLSKFTEKGGLTATSIQQVSQLVPGTMKVQWAHPNGWAPLQFIVVEALKRYGYYDEAEKVARQWLKTNLDWFSKHGEFIEKYNVVNPDKLPAAGLYPSQKGFGWTNAVFERFCQDYIDPIEPKRL
jgi:alpha,alpha-trehalase